MLARGETRALAIFLLAVVVVETQLLGGSIGDGLLGITNALLPLGGVPGQFLACPARFMLLAQVRPLLGVLLVVKNA